MKLLVTGSRAWPTRAWSDVWRELGEASSLVLGDCPTGVDLWARRYAAFYQVPHVVHAARWVEHGRAAGPMRNQLMVEDKPESAVAFLVNSEPNRGTKDCMRRCESNRVPLRVVVCGVNT